MGCNCKVKKDIITIHKKYGQKINVSWKERTLFNVKNKLLQIVYILIMLFLSPVIILFFIFFLVKGNKVININKILGKLMGKNG